MAVKAEAVDCFGVSEPVRNSGGDGEGEGKEGLFMLSLLGKERVSAGFEVEDGAT